MRRQPLREVIHVFQDITSLLQNELPIISTIRLFDLLDIAILSLIIYKLLWMLRKSSSGRVLRGILILLVAMWISSELPLTATSFMLNKVVEWGVLVLWRSKPLLPRRPRHMPTFPEIRLGL